MWSYYKHKDGDIIYMLYDYSLCRSYWISVDTDGDDEEEMEKWSPWSRRHSLEYYNEECVCSNKLEVLILTGEPAPEETPTSEDIQRIWEYDANMREVKTCIEESYWSWGVHAKDIASVGIPVAKGSKLWLPGDPR